MLVRFTPKGCGIPIPPISPLYSLLCDICLTSPSWWEQVSGLGEQFKPQFWHHSVEPAPQDTSKHLYSFLSKLLAALTVAQEPNLWFFMSILVRLYLSKSHPAQQEKWNPSFQLIRCHQIPSHFPPFRASWVPAAQNTTQNTLHCRVCIGTYSQAARKSCQLLQCVSSHTAHSSSWCAQSWESPKVTNSPWDKLGDVEMTNISLTSRIPVWCFNKGNIHPHTAPNALCMN